MKNGSMFTRVILLIVLAIVCLIMTVGAALIAGSVRTTIFDFSTLNVANLLPVLLVGGFISSIVVGISVLFFARTAFYKWKDYINKTNKSGGNKE